MAHVHDDTCEHSKGGRPTKYTHLWPDLLIKAMASGKSVQLFCDEQDISTSTFYKYVAEHKEFSSAFDIAANKCEAHWERWLMENLCNKDVNAGLTKMYFTNRFGWKGEKAQIEQHTIHSISDGTQRKVREVL